MQNVTYKLVVLSYVFDSPEDYRVQHLLLLDQLGYQLSHIMSFLFMTADRLSEFLLDLGVYHIGVIVVLIRFGWTVRAR
jgi:hypothetical protein